MESPFCADHPSAADPRQDPNFRLIETFGYVPGQGVARLDLHLARMERSAQAMGISFDKSIARQIVEGGQGSGPLRCRLTLDPSGVFDLTTAPFPAPLKVMRFKIADVALCSSDVWLKHKTTRRKLYDDARAALPDGVDELVFLNERGEVCEGTITNISITTCDGERLTPPLKSGCLPGVYRQSRLNKGLLREEVLTLDDLRAARGINLVNSLRGSTRACWLVDDPLEKAPV